MTKLNQKEAAEAAKPLENATPQEVLKWGIEKFGSRLSLASSFGLEDVVLIDMFTKLDPKARVFTLDTGRLHQESYAAMFAKSSLLRDHCQLSMPGSPA